MTATNHALTGAIIGAFLPLPLAIPIAFASHFILDALPHYGIPHKLRNTSLRYRLIVLGDTIVALSIAAVAIIYRRWNMEIVGWIAYSPDITWVFHYFRHGKNLQFKTMNKFMDFHRSIQRYERPWGIIVELIVFAALLPIFIMQIMK